MKAGGNASAAIDSVADDLEGFDDLDDVELPDVSATPKLKDYLPFMAKGGKSGSAGNAIAAVAAAGMCMLGIPLFITLILRFYINS